MAYHFVWVARMFSAFPRIHISVSFCFNLTTFLPNIAPRKAKVRNTRGVATPTHQAKRIKMACNKRLPPATTVHSQHQIDAKEVVLKIQQDDTEKVDALVTAVMDLSR